MKSLRTLIFLICLLCLSLAGCTEDPTTVGKLFIPNQDIPQMRIDTLYATSHITRSQSIVTSTADRVLLGASTSYDAIAIVKFTGLSPSVLDTIVISSAYLQLHPVYHFGDSLAPIAFSVFKADSALDTTSYTTLKTQASAYYSSTPMGAFPPTIVDDTTAIQCALDTGVVSNWFTATGSLYNYGVVLIASRSTTIKGFGSFNHATSYDRPILIVNYTKSGIPGTFFVTTGDSRFVANIDQASLVLNPDLMYVQAGVSYRGQLYFNLSSLPKAAQILKANLELTLSGPDSRLNSYTGDTLFSYFVTQSDSLATSGWIPSQSLTDAKGRKFYSFAIRDDVRSWSTNPTYESMQFGAENETSSLDLFAIFGTTTSADTRPRLIITSTYVIQ